MINQILNRMSSNKFTLIAEIGVNYYDIAQKENISPMEAAKMMVKEAADAGIHAVKFQTYKADTLAVKDSPYYWDIKEEPTKTQHELFQKYDSFGCDEYQELAKYAEDLGIEFLSTPFDIESADYLCNLMNVYKISSSDLNNLEFVAYQAQKNKPILLSVGAANEDEIERSVAVIRQYNNQPLVLMHCVLEYPTPYEHANLRKIASLKRKFPDCIIGYSDHTRPSENCDVQKMAYTLGAVVIEKHFTLDKSLKGNDHYHAMDPKDAKNIINGIEKIELLGGNGLLQALSTEKKARENARRSLVAAYNIKKGEIITKDMLTWKRPGTGITVDKLESVVGKKALCDIAEDAIIEEGFVEL